MRGKLFSFPSVRQIRVVLNHNSKCSSGGTSDLDQTELVERITEQFGCCRSDAISIAQKATALKGRVESDSKNWDGPNIDSDYIVSRLNMASEQISVTGKWNWWAGNTDYFSGTPRDYRIE